MTGYSGLGSAPVIYTTISILMIGEEFWLEI